MLETGKIVTANHVVTGTSYVTVRQGSDPPFSATVLARDTVRDIALLTYQPAAVTLSSYAVPLALGTRDYNAVGGPLMALGYSGVGGVSAAGSVGSAAANVGVLAQFINRGSDIGVEIVMDVPVDPGDSGGPVLDAMGKVVGMSRAILDGSSGRQIGSSYAISVDQIRDALPSLRAGQSQ